MNKHENACRLTQRVSPEIDDYDEKKKLHKITYVADKAVHDEDLLKLSPEFPAWELAPYDGIKTKYFDERMK